MKNIYLCFLAFLLMACGDSHRINDETSFSENIDSNCQFYFKTENLCLTTSWEIHPTSETFGSMLLTFTDKDQPERIISPKNDPTVVLWMTSMGHGSSPVTMERIEDGRYRASNIYFIMPGPWDIKYQLTDGPTVVEEVIENITIQ